MKQYLALLTQLDDAIPTCLESESTLGVPLTFTRDDVGAYYTQGFTFPEKTFCWISNGSLAQVDGSVGAMRTPDGTVLINTAIDGNAADGVLRNASLRIETYP